MYYDPNGQQQGQQNYPETIATPSGGEGGGTGEDFNWGDFASTSESGSQSSSSSFGGLTPWAKEWTQNYLTNLEPRLAGNFNTWNSLVQDESPIGTLNAKQLQDLLANLFNTRKGTQQGVDRMQGNFNNNTAGMSAQIEQARKLMPQQYAEEMKLYNERATQPVLNRMSSRGILDSSVTGGALSDVLRDTQAKQSDLVTQSDLWAANQNLDLSKYITEKGFDIDKYLADQSYATNQYQTDKTYDLNQTTAERQLAQEKERRQGLETRQLAYANLMPSLLNALREQTSQSQSESSGSSFGGLMELLMASQGG